MKSRNLSVLLTHHLPGLVSCRVSSLDGGTITNAILITWRWHRPKSNYFVALVKFHHMENTREWEGKKVPILNITSYKDISPLERRLNIELTSKRRRNSGLRSDSFRAKVKRLAFLTTVSIFNSINNPV